MSTKRQLGYYYPRSIGSSNRHQWLSVFAFLFCFHLVCAQNWLLDHIIPPGYDPNEVPSRPNVDNGTLLINGTIILNHFQATDHQRSIHTDMLICLKWHDYRLLNFNPVPVNHTNDRNFTETVKFESATLINYQRFWTPKVYFRNALSAEVVHSLQNMRYVEVFPGDKILNLCSRMNVHFVCHMNLSNFPFDAQDCPFELASFNNEQQNLRIRLQMLFTTDGNFQFRVHHHYNGTCLPRREDPFKSYRREPNGPPHYDYESCAYVTVRLTRSLNYYIMRYYAPTFLCLCISFIEFWVNTNGWPARIICTCVVEMTVKSISETAYDEIPSPDVVALFWWLWVIQFFIYMNLLEFATALAWVQFAGDKNRAHAANRESPDGYYFGKRGWYRAVGQFIYKILYRIYGRPKEDFFRDPQGRNKVDFCARIVYPTLMMIFVVVYIFATIPHWVAFRHEGMHPNP